MPARRSRRESPAENAGSAIVLRATAKTPVHLASPENPAEMGATAGALPSANPDQIGTIAETPTRRSRPESRAMNAGFGIAPRALPGNPAEIAETASALPSASRDQIRTIAETPTRSRRESRAVSGGSGIATRASPENPAGIGEIATVRLLPGKSRATKDRAVRNLAGTESRPSPIADNVRTKKIAANFAPTATGPGARASLHPRANDPTPKALVKIAPGAKVFAGLIPRPFAENRRKPASPPRPWSGCSPKPVLVPAPRPVPGFTNAASK